MRPLPGAEHVRRFRAAAVHDAEHIDAEDPLPVRCRRREEIACDRDAGGVQREVESTEAPGEGIDGKFHGGLVRDVDGESLAMRTAERPKRLGRAREPGAVVIEQREMPAARREELGGREPEAARPTGDYGAFLGKLRIERVQAHRLWM